MKSTTHSLAAGIIALGFIPWAMPTFGTELEMTGEFFIQSVLKHDPNLEAFKTRDFDQERARLVTGALLAPSLEASSRRTEDRSGGLNSTSARGTDRHDITFRKPFQTGTSLSLSVAATKVRDPYQSSAAAGYATGVKVVVEQDILRDLGGRSFRATRKSAEDSAKAATARSKADALKYLSTMLDIYHQAASTSDSITLAQEDMARESRRLALYKKRYQRGFLKRSDLLQLEQSQIDVAARLQALEQSFASNLLQLESALQIPVTDLIRRNRLSLSFRWKEPPVKSCAKDAPTTWQGFERMASEAKISALTNQLEVAKLRDLPKLYVSLEAMGGGYDPTSLATAGGESTSFRDPTYQGLIGLSWQLGDGDQDAAILDTLQARSQEQIRFEQARQAHLVQRRTGCLQVSHLRQMLAALDAKRRLATKRLDILGRDYESGRISIDSLIGAELSVKNIDREIIADRRSLHQSLWDLAIAEGYLDNDVTKALGGT